MPNNRGPVQMENISKFLNEPTCNPVRKNSDIAMRDLSQQKSSESGSSSGAGTQDEKPPSILINNQPMSNPFSNLKKE